MGYVIKSFQLENGWRVYANSEQAVKEGNFFLSVTTVLEPWTPKFLSDWKIKNTQKTIETKMNKGANFGTHMHKLVEDDLTGEGVLLETLNKDERKCFDNWMSLRDSWEITPVETEGACYSSVHGYAGRYDFLANFKGELGVGDLKTSRMYSRKFGWQLAAYKYAIEERGEHKNLGMYGVHVPSDGGKSNVFKYANYEPLYLCFLGLLQAFKTFHYKELKNMNWVYINHNPIKEIIYDTA